MDKYIVYIDWMIGEGPEQGYTYIPSDRRMDITDAMNWAEELTRADKKAGKIYLTRIMRRMGSTQYKDGLYHEPYKAILCRRSEQGWHINDEEHGEGEHWADKSWAPHHRAHPMIHCTV